MTRRPSEPPSLDELLECLVWWPEQTNGWVKERDMLRLLHALCTEHGYGFMGQVMGWIERLWREPEFREELLRMKREKQKSVGQGGYGHLYKETR